MTLHTIDELTRLYAIEHAAEDARRMRVLFESAALREAGADQDHIEQVVCSDVTDADYAVAEDEWEEWAPEGRADAVAHLARQHVGPWEPWAPTLPASRAVEPRAAE